ncbi:endo-beta-N-acetylglucosaminidase H [Leifsonia sp. 71-9]|uniref:endo-beta-N-acetylglucosaminidase H n=1 Tax=Leifsonia sp. 71-9 TaxID=1895934 RepID=UPI0009297EF9|nr:endo-beta-N-acetylglucosaminidase H [Leifsonia sp. 71-9]OJX80341.1 MAG: chitinase [Leifsonia sp. 71-9]
MTDRPRIPHHRPRRLGLAAIAAAGVVALLAGPASAATATAASPGGGRANAPTSVAYVEVNDSDLANVGAYRLADGGNAFDVAIIFAANVNRDGTQAQLHLNERVQWTLDNAATQIRPLQARGIRVLLSVLGNHQGAGVSNFTTPAQADAFAAQVADAVTRYGLDGVDLDDEYSDYGVDGTARPNQQSIGWLLTALRGRLPDAVLSFYDIGPASTALRSATPAVASTLTYAWNAYYGTYNAPAIPGLTKAQLSAAAVDIRSTPVSVATGLAKRTIADGYGVFMTYNLPNGDRSSYVSALTTALYGQPSQYRP